MIHLSIWTSITDFFGGLEQWFIEQSSDPLLWLGLFFGGLLLFGIAFNALNKQR